MLHLLRLCWSLSSLAQGCLQDSDSEVRAEAAGQLPAIACALCAQNVEGAGAAAAAALAQETLQLLEDEEVRYLYCTFLRQ